MSTVADLVLVNGDVVSMDPLRPRVRAVAIAGGRIMATGADDAMLSLAGPHTRVIDLGGRMVLPGFQDAHIHLQDGGLDLAQNAALWDVRSIEALQAVLARHAAAFDGPFIIGCGWQPGVFTAENLTRHVLDAVISDRPCLVYDSGYHNACLNSKGCEMAGIVAGTPDPPNGHFVRDAAGVPTGMLNEDAIYHARDRLPEPTEEDYAAGVLAGQAHCNRNGITGVLDAMVRERHVRVYQRLADAGRLTLRVASTAVISPDEPLSTALGRIRSLRHEARHPHFKVHSAKFFLDGVLENRTAAMIEPYADGEGGNAPLMFGDNAVRDLFVAFDAERFQIHVHAIGDAAVRGALDGLEAARAINGPWPSLHQIAHVQVTDPADFGRFGALGAMANMQPLWARHEPDIPDRTMAMVGVERARNVYAFRSLIDAGAPFCLSSDWPVSTLNPFEIIETALTRQPPRRVHGDVEPFFPEQRLTREECLAGYTVNAAAACWRAGETGSLAPGKSADLIVLDRDILACDVHDIGGTVVLLTLFEGREVWRDPSFAR